MRAAIHTRGRSSVTVISLLLSACSAVSDPRDSRDGGPVAHDNVSADSGEVFDGTKDAGAEEPTADAGPMFPPFVSGNSCLPLAAEMPTVRSVELQDAYPGLRFSSPVLLTAAAGSSWNFVVEQAGRIYVFDGAAAAPTKSLFLDLSDVVEAGGEKGLLGLALHPEHESNGVFFVSYTERDEGQLSSVVARYTATSGAGVPAVTSGSGEVLLRVAQPYDNNNGGVLAFGPDGYLYVALGDGGSGGDPLGHAQNTTTLLGALLRIDINSSAPPLRYGIPSDNPLASGAAGAPEVVAYGLRDPRHFSFDRSLGDLWIADVGQGAFEEVNHLPSPFPFLAAGGAVNFGWNRREGFVCYPSGEATGCSSASTDPLVAYDRTAGQSVIGGYVYRGSAHPALVGKYFFADFASRHVWSTSASASPGLVTAADALMVAPTNISSFGEDGAGELFLLGDGEGAALWRLVPGNVETTSMPVATLSETGCFDDLEVLRPAPGVVPYEVALPFWSDGAHKQRFVSLPPAEKFEFDAQERWQAPLGTVFVKHFELDVESSGDVVRRRLETRFLVVEEDGMRMFSYRWRQDESDADLLLDAAVIPVTGHAVISSWSVPSPTQCLLCHTPASGGLLGAETAQWNRTVEHDGFSFNQLEAFESWGLLDLEGAAAAELPAFAALDDETATAGARARAWLHVNCASCHLPNGGTGRNLDLRYHVPLSETRTCDVYPQGYGYGLSQGRLLVPGYPDRSLLHFRANATGAPARMPPIGKVLADEPASAVRSQWIEGLTSCDDE